MQKAEQQIAEKRKIFTRAKYGSRLFRIAGKSFTGSRREASDGSRAARSSGTANGDGSLSRVPRSVLTDFGPPNLQMSIEAL
jgi:hypothetical protein